MDEHEITEMMKQELWIPANFKVWKAEKDAKEKEKLLNSGRLVFLFLRIIFYRSGINSTKDI